MAVIVQEQYSLPICVRNTFIDTTVEVSPSLACFLRTREVRTCPSSKVGRFAGLFEEPLEEEEQEAPAVVPVEATPKTVTPKSLLWAPTPTPRGCRTPPTVLLSLAELCFSPSEKVGRLQPALPPPTLPAPGSEELPSIGSSGHHEGTCKPCAFFHTAGCSNGLTCEFCHLCDDGERKRRRKAKAEARRASKRGGA